VTPPDFYEQARKAVEEEKAKTAQAATAKPGEAGGDIQIQSIIRKSASGETQDTTVLGGAGPDAAGGGQKEKKD
jgi:hypothetical protein